MNIRLISASAGSGKTFHLTREEMARSVAEGAPAESMLATTFTVKAARELTQRARGALLAKGCWDQAQMLADGYVGTVNSVCGRLLRELCFSGGLSPTQQVLPENESGLAFKVAMAEIAVLFFPELSEPARRLSIDWQETVQEIVKQARYNNIPPERLEAMGRRSLACYLRLLPPFPDDDTGRLMDSSLRTAVADALGEMEQNGDTTAGTQKAKDLLYALLQKLERDPASLTWVEWLRLHKIKPRKASRGACGPVIGAAARHCNHPRFGRDLEAFISGVFRCAKEVMQAYAEYKKAYGLVDFVDQEREALSLLRRDDVSSRLRQRLHKVLVDEFQDTSPIQLALFLELARLAPESVWVGDQKQAIYGFRGTDPLLMDGVIDTVVGADKLGLLGHSWRSRPELVAFTNELFARAFAPLGLPPERVRLHPKRTDALQGPCPLQLWGLTDTTNQEGDMAALAAGVRDLLQTEDMQVLDKATNTPRSLRADDVAILCRTNDTTRAVADALETLGVRASVGRGGLLNRPESVLTLAGLRWLTDPKDTLAAAEILHLTGAPRAWLTELLTAGDDGYFTSHPALHPLVDARESILHLTPLEALDLAADRLNLKRVVSAWPRPNSRLENIEALRKLALEYEQYCLVSGRACTPGGLVAWLDEVKKQKLDEQAASQDETAVRVLTYHKAKGLEWPVVVMYELNKDPRIAVFGNHVEASDEPFDPNDPLKGRWIRCWPWPYDRHKKEYGFDSQVDACPEAAAAKERETREEIRLLYVGMTRARDYLILAARGGGAKPLANWLTLLADEDNKPLLHFEPETEPPSFSVGDNNFPADFRSFSPVEDAATVQEEPPVIFADAPDAGKPYPPAYVSPSRIEITSPPGLTTKTIDLGPRLSLTGTPAMDTLGSAVHAFLAVDSPGQEQSKRLHRAESTLATWTCPWIQPGDLVTAGDRLWAWIENTYPKARLFKEWPVMLRLGDQKSRGWIDLLIETEDGYVIIDHKTFPGSRNQWGKKALEYSPQLGLYKQAVEQAKGKKVLDLFIHMPVVGSMVKISS